MTRWLKVTDVTGCRHIPVMRARVYALIPDKRHIRHPRPFRKNAGPGRIASNRIQESSAPSA
jgi:hypothetical protein